MKKIFALIFILILSGISSESFATIKTISELQSIDFENNVNISLSDGYSYIALTDPCEIGILETWKVGDQIKISADLFRNSLTLTNQDSDILYSPKVKLSQASIEKLPTIVKISETQDEDPDDIDDFVVFDIIFFLSDGSVWKTDSADFDLGSKVGDRVIVNIPTFRSTHRDELSKDEISEALLRGEISEALLHNVFSFICFRKITNIVNYDILCDQNNVDEPLIKSIKISD